jgi:chromosome segregation ATPase
MSSQSPQDTTNDATSAVDWGTAKQAAANLTQQALVADLERGYLAIQKERDDLQAQVDKVKLELRAAQEAMVVQQDLERQTSIAQHQLSLQQQRGVALEEEKKTVEERMDRIQAEADNLRGEIR